MYYKLVADGNHRGVDTRNTFYYRTGLGIDISGLDFGGAKRLAEVFRQQVWADAWRGAVSNDFTLQKITVYPINEAFRYAFNLPYELPVNENGTAGGDDLSPASVVIMRFNLEPQSFIQGMISPKRGYVAISGVVEGQQANGILESEYYRQSNVWFGRLAGALAGNLEHLVPPPFTIFFPIRMKLIDNPVSNSPIAVGWSDVQSVSVDPVLSWRRSRRPK